jgi:rfaE bifunctional protein nucleotidyltransferase chain/domain
MNQILLLPRLIFKIKNQLKKKTLVLTTGCFDVLHPGHKQFLKAAKAQGQILIVGLEQDQRVAQLKGESRPINPLEQRMKNLAKLNLADYIFPLPLKFNQDKDYKKLLQNLYPHILAVSQNTPFLKKKKKMIKNIGGKLYIFPFNPQYSTTKIIFQK